MYIHTVMPQNFLYTVDLENFGVKKLRKAHTSMKLKHMRFFTMMILLSNN